MEWFQYDELAGSLNDFMPSLGDSFLQIFKSLIAGEDVELFPLVINTVCSAFESNLQDFSGVFFLLVLLGIVTGLLKQISGVFKEKSMGEVTFYICYMCGVILLLNLFFIVAETALTMIETMVRFTEILIPFFYLSVAVGRQIYTAVGFYQLNLILLYAVEVIVPEIILPVISCIAYLSVLSGLSGEDRFDGFVKMLQKGVNLLLKGGLTVVAGIGVMKKILHGAVDGMNYTTFRKTIGAIPGVGDFTDSVSSVLVASAVLIKSGLGIAFLILLIILLCAPMCKILVIAFALQLISATIGMMEEKRFVRCAEQISKACYLLLKACLVTAAVFLVVIALVAVTA